MFRMEIGRGEGGGGAGVAKHPKKMRPLLISASLKVATSNLVHNVGLGSML